MDKKISYISDFTDISNLIPRLQDPNTIVVFKADRELRKEFYRWIENNHLDIIAVGVLIDVWPNKTTTHKKCMSCRDSIELTYHRGMLPNNEDEYYSGYCDACDCNVSWECNYDLRYGVYRVRYNNAIAFSPWLTRFKTKKSDPTTDPCTDAPDIQKDKKIYTIPVPEKCLSRSRVNDYLTDRIKQTPI